MHWNNNHKSSEWNNSWNQHLYQPVKWQIQTLTLYQWNICMWHQKCDISVKNQQLFASHGVPPLLRLKFKYYQGPKYVLKYTPAQYGNDRGNKCRLNHCLEWYKWVLTNLDHDTQWFNTLISPSHKSPVVFVCRSFSELRRCRPSLLQLQGYQ